MTTDYTHKSDVFLKKTVFKGNNQLGCVNKVSIPSCQCKASTDRKRAGREREGAMIRRMSFYSRHSDRSLVWFSLV